MAGHDNGLFLRDSVVIVLPKMRASRFGSRSFRLAIRRRDRTPLSV
jgi:hypothetical protein